MDLDGPFICGWCLEERAAALASSTPPSSGVRPPDRVRLPVDAGGVRG